MSTISNLDAVRDAIAVEMRLNPRIILFGEGTGERGGSFAHTKGLWQEFGPSRLIDTPVSELGFVGAAVGAAATGMHPIADMMFVDFIADAMSQLVNQAAKLHYASGGTVTVPMVVRASMGSVRGAAAHHSGCLYPWFMHIPGLKVVTYSNPADGYGLMRTALRDPNPVVFLDHKALFGVRGEAPQPDLLVPFGQAAVCREGRDVTVVAVAAMVPRALNAAETLAAEGISVEVVDPRTLVPLDMATILASVRKTKRLLTVEEGALTGGLGAEIAARVAKEAFDYLDAPIERLAGRDCPIPFSPLLEEAMYPTEEQIVATVKQMLGRE